MEEEHKTETTKKQLTGVILIALIIGLTVGVLISYSATPSETYYLSGGINPGAPSYTIFIDSGNYYAKNAHGQIVYDGTNASEIITSAVNALTTGGSIIFSTGTFTITNTIEIPYLAAGTYNIRGQGVSTKLQMNDSVNIIMFNVSCSWVSISDFDLDGNSDENTAGTGIKHNCPPTTGSINTLFVERCLIHNFSDYGIWGSGQANNLTKFLHSNDNVIFYCDKGIYLDNWHYSAYISNTEIYWNDYGLHFEGNQEHHVINCYIWECYQDGIYLYDVENVDFTQVTSSTNENMGFRLEICQNITFHNCKTDNNDQSGSGLESFKIENSTYISVIGGVYKNLAGVFTQDWGLRERGTSDYNMIIGVDASENSVGGILTAGSNTKVNLCWNNTSWIS